MARLMSDLSLLANKHIILGITGGIAAYKSAFLVRGLTKAGAQVRVIMTQGGKAFITPLTMQALSGEAVRDSLLDTEAEAGMGHIELARWADLIVIAPAGANVIAELAQGSACHLLTTVCLASTAKKVLCPAMNMHMWLNPAVQRNMTMLHELGFQSIGPEMGEQACGDVGLGRMSEVEAILPALTQCFQGNALHGKSVLITLGPTREYLDPVRYVSNESSGQMGYALAMAAAHAGAKVTVIAGPTPINFSPKMKVHSVTSALEMFDAVNQRIGDADVFISTAAVSDYRCQDISTQKMKKTSENELILPLTKNPDIVAEVGLNRLCDFVVGFAAETHEIERFAKEKLVNKGLDLIIANQVGIEGNGFNSAENEVTLYGALGKKIAFKKMKKDALAHVLIDVIAQEIEIKMMGNKTK